MDPRAILAISPRQTANSLPSTVFNSTPFLFLLAAYSLLHRSIPRGKTALLASVFTGSVLLYTLDVLPNGELPGQRMYVEGLAGIAALDAAGFLELLKKWRVNRVALLRVVVVLSAVQFTHYVLTARDVRAWVEASVDLHATLRSVACNNCVVFMRSENLTPSHALAPRNFNVNDADWPHAPHIYLADPGPSRRNQVTGRIWTAPVSACNIQWLYAFSHSPADQAAGQPQSGFGRLA